MQKLPYILLAIREMVAGAVVVAPGWLKTLSDSSRRAIAGDEQKADQPRFSIFS
jgi:hypothetical protein